MIVRIITTSPVNSGTQALAHRPDHHLDAVLGAERPQDVRHMVADRPVRDDEPRSDLDIGTPLSDEGGDLALTGGQRGDARVTASR